MTAKELDARIDRWRARMGVEPARMYLAYIAIKYGYRLAKEEFKKEQSLTPSIEKLTAMVREIHARVVPPPCVSYKEEDNEEPEEE